MAKFKCDCGAVLSNSHSPNDTVLIVFSDGEWENIQEDVQNGRNIFDFEPPNEVWRCLACGRIYIFRESQLVLQYKIEKDYRGR
jgi:hypothetical protein